MEFKLPTTKEGLEKLANGINELSDDELDVVAGGNDDLKGKAGLEWTCPYCGQTKYIKMVQDAAKHMTKECPGNPYK